MFNGPNRRKGRPPTVKPKYRVNLTYFKQNGGFHTEGSYVSEKEELQDIWLEVRQMRNVQQLPGLINGTIPPITLIDVPTHPNRHPHLVL